MSDADDMDDGSSNASGRYYIPSSSEEEEDSSLVIALLSAYEELSASTPPARVDHRTLPRSKRQKYSGRTALFALNRDILGPNALYGSQFKAQFRITRSRFQRMMEDIMASGINFYAANDRTEQASLEAKLLLPLKTLAYGVPPHAFMIYFQFSKTYANTCCKEFDQAIKKVYTKEYLRIPTAADLKAITNLHKKVHGVDGLLGSLDCTHTYWKNCPTAWQPSYKGKEHMPSVVLEAMCDYHLYFWHLSYGYPGALNDKIILSLSPLLDSMIDGTFDDLEKEAGVVPFNIGDESFTKTFILVDGIYPSYSRFVKGIKHPSNPRDTKFTAWQEAARKDIERAFGVLKAVWQFCQRPILVMKTRDIALRVACCTILHNMIVSDRVMQDCRATYKPDAVLDEEEVTDTNTIVQPQDLTEVQQAMWNAQMQTRAKDIDDNVTVDSATVGTVDTATATTIATTIATPTVNATNTRPGTTTRPRGEAASLRRTGTLQSSPTERSETAYFNRMMTRIGRFKELKNVEEHARLLNALKCNFYTSQTSPTSSNREARGGREEASSDNPPAGELSAARSALTSDGTGGATPAVDTEEVPAEAPVEEARASTN
jgi:hypothetical protein